MTLSTPLFLQPDIAYSAREVRDIFTALWRTEGVLDPIAGDLLVTQRGAGANMSVDVATGYAVIAGDDQADQGSYLEQVTALHNVVIPAAPGANSRIDSIVLRIRDPLAGGAAGNDAILEVVSGAVAGAPVPPAIPNSAIELARVLVAAGTVAITNAMITDRRLLRPLEIAGRAASAEKLTGEESTTSTTFVALATPVALTARIGSSGKALVILNAQMRNASGGAAYVTLELTGANVVAALEAGAYTLGLTVDATTTVRTCRTALLSGLNPGDTTFTERAKVASGTGHFYNRHYVVIPL